MKYLNVIDIGVYIVVKIYLFNLWLLKRKVSWRELISDSLYEGRDSRIS
jgi:hypothetical protein